MGIVRKLTICSAVASLLLSGVPATPALADAFSDAQQRQQNLNGSLAKDKTHLKQLQGQVASTQQQLNLLSGQVASAEQALANQNARLDAINGQIDQAQRDLAAKKADQARQQDLLNRRTRALYKHGGQTSLIDSLFTANTFSQLMDRFIVMRDITHQDQLLLQQIQGDRAAIEAINASLQQNHQAQAAVVAGIQQQTNALQGQYAQMYALRAQLGVQAASAQSQVAAAERALQQVNAELAALAAARRLAHSSGVLAWPGVQGPITQRFACTDFAGEPSPPPGYHCPPSAPYFHTGIDVAGPFGAAITAADSGIANVYPGSFGYGNHVIIVHANGYATLYGHMSGFAVHSGQVVAKGQTIGYEGSTGFSSGPHLHFEVRLNDVPQDPCRYVGC